MSGTLDGPADARFAIEIFLIDTCDPSGNGEGLTWLTDSAASTNNKGKATFSVVIDSLAPTDHVAALAFHKDGNTSEFSASI